MRLASRYGLEIRAATGADAPGLAELMSACGYVVPPRILAERLDGLGRQPGAALVALEWGPPSGVVTLHWYQTLSAESLAARLTMLLVGPDAQRRGVGRLLLKAAAQAARAAGCETLQLLAPADQTAAHQFCRATGFAEIGAGYVRSLRRQGQVALDV